MSYSEAENLLASHPVGDQSSKSSKCFAQHNGAPLVTVEELVGLAKTAADLIEQMDALRGEFEKAYAVNQQQADQLTEIVRSAVAKARAKAQNADTT